MSPRQRWTLVAAVLGSGVVFLDSSVVSVALPAIGELPSTYFGVLEGQSYVYNAFLLTLSALLIPAGALSDRKGRRRVFLWGLAGFGASSMFAALAPSLEALVLARSLQGAAAAFLVPGSLALITTCFPAERRGRAVGVWAAGATIAMVVGPPIAGMVVDRWSWRGIFYLSLPLVAAALWVTAARVDESVEPGAPGLRWSEALAAAVGIGGITVGLIRGQQTMWQEPWVFVALLLGVAGVVALPIMSRVHADPMIDPALFASRNFRVVNIGTLLVYGGIYTSLYYVALYLQGVLGYTATAAGVVLLAPVLPLAVGSPLVGRLTEKRGSRALMTAGPLLMATASLALLRLTEDAPPWLLGDPGGLIPPAETLTEVILPLLVFGLGTMLLVAPLTTTLLASVEPQRAGVASALNNAVSRVGPQLAGALMFVAVTAVFTATLAGLTGVPASELEGYEPLNPPPPGTPPAVEQATDLASTAGFRAAMGITAGLFLTGALVHGIGIRDLEVSEAGAGGD